MITTAVAYFDIELFEAYELFFISAIFYFFGGYIIFYYFSFMLWLVKKMGF